MKEKKPSIPLEERRRLWKEAKEERKRERAAKKQKIKEYYQYAPWIVRAWHYWLRTVVIVLAVIAALCVIFGQSILSTVLMSYVSYTRDEPITQEDIEAGRLLAPVNEEDAARIDAYPDIGKDETWTICFYAVGADLEDDGENDLSYAASLLTKDAREARKAQSRQELIGRLQRFNQELDANGLELPAFYYNPEKPVASEGETAASSVSSREGFASEDIQKLSSGTWGDNIKVVIQTGGALRWSNEMVNPNRTQRFLYAGGTLKEVANLPMQPASQPETLSDFLRFCDEEYPSDHRMLVLWDHGGGPFGYGMDSIYGDMFSLKDIRKALSDVYGTETKKAPFDIIGFDACLMSTLEVTHALRGFADYYCLSEETEPAYGWDYGPLLQAMTDQPTMSPAKVARTVADTYMDHYMGENAKFNSASLGDLLSSDVTISVIEAKKAEELYDAYCELAQAQLVDAAKDIGVLSEIGRCGAKSTRYGGSYYDVFNIVDLGNYASYMVDSYPDQSSKISRLVKESVLYHRENGYLSDSTGIAVYIPAKVNNVSGLLYYLDYVYNISEDPGITALYYYKQAGCLTDEQKAYVATLTEQQPKTLDVSLLRAFTKAEPVIDSEGFVVPVDEKLQSLIADYQMEVGLLDETAATITYYGRDERLYLDGEGKLCSNFKGDWISLDGQPLSLEIVSSSPSSVQYRSRVKYNDADAWLELRYDRDSEALTITGVRDISMWGDPINSYIDTKNVQEVQEGSKITPVYTVADLINNSSEQKEGKAVTFSKNTKLERNMLTDGKYLSTDVIFDQRGDSYYSGVVSATIQGSSVTWALEPNFYGTDR